MVFVVLALFTFKPKTFHQFQYSLVVKCISLAAHSHQHSAVAIATFMAAVYLLYFLLFSFILVLCRMLEIVIVCDSCQAGQLQQVFKWISLP